jgi:hypothetical protein
LAANAASQQTVTRRRVLVIEDNIEQMRSLVMLLRLEGHEVQFAINGYAALEVVKKFRPDIVFLDLGLPGLDGFQVCARLKREPGLEYARVIALTRLFPRCGPGALEGVWLRTPHREASRPELPTRSGQQQLGACSGMRGDSAFPAGQKKARRIGTALAPTVAQGFLQGRPGCFLPPRNSEFPLSQFEPAP